MLSESKDRRNAALKSGLRLEQTLEDVGGTLQRGDVLGVELAKALREVGVLALAKAAQQRAALPG